MTHAVPIIPLKDGGSSVRLNVSLLLASAAIPPMFDSGKLVDQPVNDNIAEQPGTMSPKNDESSLFDEPQAAVEAVAVDQALEEGKPESHIKDESVSLDGGINLDVEKKQLYESLYRLPALNEGLECLYKRGNINLWEMGVKNLYRRGTNGFELNSDMVDSSYGVVPDSEYNGWLNDLMSSDGMKAIDQWRKQRAEDVIEFVSNSKEQLVTYRLAKLALQEWLSVPAYKQLLTRSLDVLPVTKSEWLRSFSTIEMERFKEKKYEDGANSCLYDDYVPISENYYTDRAQIRQMKPDVQRNLCEKAVNYLKSILDYLDGQSDVKESDKKALLIDNVRIIGTGWEDLAVFGLYKTELEGSSSKPNYS